MKTEIYQKIAEAINSVNYEQAAILLSSLNKIDLLRIIEWTKDKYPYHAEIMLNLASAWNIALIMEKYLPEVLAFKFIQAFNQNINDDERQEIVRLNKEDPDKSICHSHDFTDPNEFMIQALQELEIELKFTDENFQNLLCKAWEIAKEKEFLNSYS